MGPPRVTGGGYSRIGKIRLEEVLPVRVPRIG
jgi:hypothetical protein